MTVSIDIGESSITFLVRAEYSIVLTRRGGDSSCPSDYFEVSVIGTGASGQRGDTALATWHHPHYDYLSQYWHSPRLGQHANACVDMLFDVLDSRRKA